MSHGKTICKECEAVVMQCRCVFFHQNVEWVTCHQCSDRANMEKDPGYIAAMEEESE